MDAASPLTRRPAVDYPALLSKLRRRAGWRLDFSSPFDPAEHPRGGYPENPGEFSPAGGAVETPADDETPGASSAKPAKGKGRDPDYVGDPYRDAAHAFADDVNGRIAAAEADAKVGAKYVVREAPKAYKAELARFKASDDYRDLSAMEKAGGEYLDSMPDDEFNALPDEGKKAVWEGAEGAAQDAVGMERAVELHNKHGGVAGFDGDVGFSEEGAADTTAEHVARAAAAQQVYDALSPAQREAVLPDGASQLDEDLSNGDGTLDADEYGQRAYDHLEYGEHRTDALAAALEAVPAEHRPYIDAHESRINDAVDEGGKLNADKVFAETDDETPAIPAKAGEEAAASINVAYKAEVAGREKPLREAAAKAEAEFAKAQPVTAEQGDAVRGTLDDLNETWGSREDDDEDAATHVDHAIAAAPESVRGILAAHKDAMVEELGDAGEAQFDTHFDGDQLAEDAAKAATSAGIGPKHDSHDAFVEDLMGGGEISDDNKAPTEDDLRDAAESVVKAAVKAAPKSAKARLKHEAESLAETLANDGEISADYFHAQYKP